MKRIHFKKIPSTHLYAKNNLLSFKLHPLTVITADYQTRGIGRRQDKWHAPKNTSLLTSFVYRPPNSTIVPYISKICALSLKKALTPLNLPIEFKYPNDLLINGKKVSGIISEVCGNTLITSIGVNISQTKNDLMQIDQPATSLFLETNRIFSAEKILLSLLKHFFTDIKQQKKNS